MGQGWNGKERGLPHVGRAAGSVGMGRQPSRRAGPMSGGDGVRLERERERKDDQVVVDACFGRVSDRVPQHE